MNDPLIDNLVDDLTPVRSFNLWQILALTCLCFIIFSFIIISNLGMRDMGYAFNSGAIYWKNGGLILSAILGFFALNNLSRPENKNNFISHASIFFAPILILFLISINQNLFLTELKNPNFNGMLACASNIFIFGTILFALVYKMFLSKSASQNPKTLGLISGLACGFTAASAYALHCNMDGFIYFIIAYLLPIATLGIIGIYIGIKRLKW